jgi:hypothetical protein
MSALDPILDAELAKDRISPFGAILIDLPGGPARFLDCGGTVTFAAGSFAGEDPTWGVLADLDDLEDGSGDEAPGLSFAIMPPSVEAMHGLSDPALQGTPVRMWLGAVRPVDGSVAGTPYLLFAGEIDVVTEQLDENKRQVALDCVGGMERFFAQEEGIRLASAWHKRVWPGETGLDAVTGVADTVYWGAYSASGVKS